MLSDSGGKFIYRVTLIRAFNENCHPDPGDCGKIFTLTLNVNVDFSDLINRSLLLTI